MDIEIPDLEDLRSELRALKKKSAQHGIEIVAGTLELGGLSDAQISELESVLGCKLPNTFRRFCQTYDLSRLQIGNTRFGDHRKYFGELLWLNCETTWWCGSPWAFPAAPRTAARPQHLIMIAQGDPLSWLVDLSDGRVLGLDVEKLYPDAMQAVENLEQFVRCRTALWLASVHNRPTEKLKAEVLRVTGGDIRAWTI